MLNINEFEISKIVSIELMGEDDTIDITVEDTHMFFANDIYTHNSAANDDIVELDKIAGAYAKVMVCDFVMTLSRKVADKLTNTARVHIPKNRFGKDGGTYPAELDLEHGRIGIYADDSPEGQKIKARINSGEGALKNLLAKQFVEMSESKKG